MGFYFIDMIRCFTEPITKDGKLVKSNKLIAKYYLLSWFLPDLYAFTPLSLIRYNSRWEDGSKDDVKNFFNFNFSRLPRFYKLLLLLTMVRARDTKILLNFIMKSSPLRVEIQNLLITFFLLIWILHIIGCFWKLASEFDIKHYTNWINSNGLQDSGILSQYIASLYWASVTCTTTGYGDIKPTNNYELFWAMISIVFGVAIFSYILSDLSSKFSEITKVTQVN